MNTYKEARFIDISTVDDFKKYADKISNLTHRSTRDILYLLYKNKKSYAFCIVLNEEILGFQGFVYKPILINEEMVPTYRSEFTIAIPELRGSGLFPKFYKYTMDVIKMNHKEVYFWGETGHKGWTNFDFKIIKKHTFYQIFSRKYKSILQKPAIYNRLLVKTICILYSTCNPFRFILRSPVNVFTKIKYEEFKKFESNGKKFKIRLYMDEEIFQWRYLNNDFQKYLFITYKESLLIIQEKENKAVIIDIYAKNVIQYLLLISYLTRQYEIVIIHGNVYAMVRVSYFWINILIGFTTFLGGGSFVERNRYAKRISWIDIPLLDSWQWGL